MIKLPFFGAFIALFNTVEVPDNRIKKGKTYTSSDLDSMLREMTGKSKSEKRKILKKYGRK